MPLQWTPALATGNETIDNQHRELFSRINAFALAIAQEADMDELEPILKFMNEYVAYHFAAEEKLLSANGYPDLAIHQSQHAFFVRNVKNIERAYAVKGPCKEVSDLVYTNVTSWLVAHIEKADGAWGLWLKKKEGLV